MRKILLILSIILTTVLSLNAQTVYFSQDFNSSTDITTYSKASAPGTNQFNATAIVGNASVNATNNKFQLVKGLGTGTGFNRGGFTRTALAGIPAAGAGFLKVSMEITLSGNEANTNNGFQFALGEMAGTAPAAPGAGQLHSLIYINPTANAGEYVIGTQSGSNNSEPLSGTKTVIWYVNNSGAPVGYTDPKGEVSTLQDDAADVWVVDENTQTLVVDEEPAVTPGVKLKGFKLSSNPTFVATFDVDDIVLQEEPVIVVPKIIAISTVPPVTVPLKTIFNLIPFAAQAEVTYEDNTKEFVAMSYAPVTSYNQYLLGTYQVVGSPIPRNGTINPDGISLTTSVTVREDIHLTNTFSPNNDGKNDTWVIEDLKRYRESSVEVFDRDGKQLFASTDPNVGWDGRNLQGQVMPGSYFYIIKIQALSLVKKGVLTVIK